MIPFDPVARAAPEIDGPGARPSRHHILLVEDQFPVREIVAQLLTKLGYAVTPAASGPEALARLDAGEPVDLILTDFSMPGMDGLDMLDEAHRRRPDLPAIIMTGYSSEAVVGRRDWLQCGRCTLIEKPVTSDHLAGEIAALLA